jgi:putative ABC transport system substrate-binding protein
MYEEGESVDDGGLFALFSDIPAAIRRSTRYIDKILRGAAPADLPVELPTTFEFVMNARTASALGLTIPPPVAVQVTRWVS